MKTFILEPKDCRMDGGVYFHGPLIFDEPTHLVIRGIKTLVIEGRKVSVAVDTGGGNLYTFGGDLYSIGGNIHTSGGNIHTRGGNIHTHGGNLNTQNGDLITYGGDLYTDGGKLDTGDGQLNSGGGDVNTSGGKINGYAPPDENTERARLLAVRAAIFSNPGLLDMKRWHGDSDWRALPAYGTTHCLAGWLQALSDNQKIRKMAPSIAGAILAPSTTKHFFDSNEAVLDWLRGI